MSAIKRLLKGQNDFINPVFNALKDRGGTTPMDDEEAAKNEAALLVGGMLIAVKVSIMQAVALIEEMELDDVIEEKE